VRLENASFAVAAMVSDVPVLCAMYVRARFHPIRAIQFKIIAPAAPTPAHAGHKGLHTYRLFHNTSGREGSRASSDGISSAEKTIKAAEIARSGAHSDTSHRPMVQVRFTGCAE
jgi:hypothetical protein